MASRTNELNQRSSQAQTALAHQNTDDPRVIRDQIEQTRAQMGETIQELQERLSPERMKQQTQEAIREATIDKVEQMKNKAEHEVRSWPTRVTRTIRENPIPAALIGIGIGWILVSNEDDNYYHGGYYAQETDTDYPSSTRRSTYQEPRLMQRRNGDDRMGKGREWIREKTDEARERVGTAMENVQNRATDAVETVENQAEEMGEQVQETFRDTQHRLQETTEQWGERAREGTQRARHSFWNSVNENPLLIGTAAVAAGALIGLSLPGTPVEDRLMGERRDYFMEEAQEAFQETAHKVQSVVREAKDAAVDTAQREMAEQDLQVSQEEDQDSRPFQEDGGRYSSGKEDQNLHSFQKKSKIGNLPEEEEKGLRSFQK